jgi:subtilase family serine protease
MLSVRLRPIHLYEHRFTCILLLFTAILFSSIVTLQFLPMRYNQANAQDTLVALTGMTSPLLASSRLQGSANGQQRITLSIGLRPQNLASLHQYVQNVALATSVRDHHFLTQAQYTSTYSPTEATYTTLMQFLQNAGFTITHTYNHRLLVDFSGTIQQVEQAFHVTLHTYRGPDGRVYYANDSNPLLPMQFAHNIIAINGLDNALHWYPTQLFAHRLAATSSSSSQAECPQHSKSYITPDQFARAYNLNGLYRAHDLGEGQTVALFELSPFAQSDIKAYSTCFGMSHTTIQAIPIEKHLTPDDGSLEVETDAELVLSVAPQLKTLKIYEAGNDVTSYLSQWARIIQDAPPVVSTSWGLCEKVLDAATIKQENVLFMAAAAQGQTIFASTGDTGSAGCLGNTVNPPKGTGIDDPAAQPFVTSVGGTSLSLNKTSSYGRETTWNTTKEPPKGYNGASGGGISQYWPAPSWQNMTGVHNIYSTGKLCQAPAGKICRETPDISLHANADRGYIVYCSAKATKSCSNSMPWNVVGGTSASAPLWAALTALANEVSLKQGGHSLGFINPLLYQLARDPQKYAICFHDITVGNNDYNGHNGGRYPATRGYDLATGLGSYNAYPLVLDLVELARQRKKA